jgi:hypothetical protein
VCSANLCRNCRRAGATIEGLCDPCWGAIRRETAARNVAYDRAERKRIVQERIRELDTGTNRFEDLASSHADTSAAIVASESVAGSNTHTVRSGARLSRRPLLPRRASHGL